MENANDYACMVKQGSLDYFNSELLILSPITHAIGLLDGLRRSEEKEKKGKVKEEEGFFSKNKSNMGKVVLRDKDALFSKKVCQVSSIYI